MFPVLVPAALAIAGTWWYVNSGVQIPAESDQVIDEVLAENSLPKFVSGKTGLAKSGNINIWYESMMPNGTPKGTVLLVMGYGTTILGWPAHFYQPLIDEGYHVIRYDNRGLGMSDWMKGWDKKNPYTLEDMAKDGMAVLDALDIEKAHIIGVSMGGMIGQRMAISHSERVLTLTSIMSSGYMGDPAFPPVAKSFQHNLVRLTLKYLIRSNSRKAAKFSIGVRMALRGDGPYEVNLKDAVQKAFYERHKRRGSNPKVRDQHGAAIAASGSRLQELKHLDLPILVVHGKSDPLVIFPHGEKSASMMPNAKTLWIEGMGHDIPEIYMEEIHEAILKNLAEG
ncbi:MAG: alpha/beta fold hydrolase [Chitinophagales bacterium]